MKKAISDHITIFSPSQVELMLEALNGLNVYFDRINHPVPNVDFAAVFYHPIIAQECRRGIAIGAAIPLSPKKDK